MAAATLAITALGVLVPLAVAQCWFGLGSCEDEPPDVTVDTASSRFNARGDDDPSDEYVCLVNASDESVDLAGWELHEGGGDVVNTLPAFTLRPGAAVRVHPGKGRDSKRDLFGTNERAIWRNDGDGVTVVDTDGREIAHESYEAQDEPEATRDCG